MGCDFGQGFHLGRPEPAADFVAINGASLSFDPAVPHAAG
jgi:EAL domain-containing protein (putative c-di-GMP-specific phosphodiesterase class I)